jgi:hypothetical protein
MRKEFMLPFETRDVRGSAKVPVKVTINGYTWRSTVGNRGGRQYIVVNADARRNAALKAGDVVTIALEPVQVPGTAKLCSSQSISAMV